jgi:hypothetical protein
MVHDLERALKELKASITKIEAEITACKELSKFKHIPLEKYLLDNSLVVYLFRKTEKNYMFLQHIIDEMQSSSRREVFDYLNMGRSL